MVQGFSRPQVGGHGDHAQKRAADAEVAAAALQGDEVGHPVGPSVAGQGEGDVGDRDDREEQGHFRSTEERQEGKQDQGKVEGPAEERGPGRQGFAPPQGADPVGPGQGEGGGEGGERSQEPDLEVRGPEEEREPGGERTQSDGNVHGGKGALDDGEPHAALLNALERFRKCHSRWAESRGKFIN